MEVMLLHLFSIPGEPFLAEIIATARQILVGLHKPLVAYLPAAAEERHFVRETKAAFRGIAEVWAIKPEIHSAAFIWSTLDRADMLYIPGGNTYLAAKRLHTAGLMDDLRKRILGGLSVVAFSAGTVLCGIDILTSNDTNDCACTNFDGFGLVPFNFNVHYPSVDGEERQRRDTWLQAYAMEHNRLILALEDGAYILVKDGNVKVIKGPVWKFQGQKKEHFHDNL
jgi:peptidase E